MKTQLLDIRKFWLAIIILTPIELAAADSSTSPTNNIAIKAPRLIDVARGETVEKR